MDRFVLLVNPLGGNTAAMKNPEKYLVLHSVNPEMVVSIKPTSARDELVLPKTDKKAIVRQTIEGFTVAMQLEIEKSFYSELTESDINKVFNRLGRWFVSYLLKHGDFQRFISFQEEPQLLTIGERIEEFNDDYKRYEVYHNEQFSKGESDGWKEYDKNKDQWLKDLANSAKGIANMLCNVLELAVGGVDYEKEAKWSESSYFEPMPFYFGMVARIQEQNTNAGFALGFDDKGYFVNYEMRYGEVLHLASNRFWQLLHEVNRFGDWEYEPNIGFSDAVEREFAFSFKSTAPTFILARDFILQYKFSKWKDGTWQDGDIKIRFKRVENIMDLLYQAFGAIAHLHHCHMELYIHRHKSLNGNPANSSRTISNNTLPFQTEN